MVVDSGDASTTSPFTELRLVLGDQVYVTPPVAVIDPDCDEQIVALEAVMVGELAIYIVISETLMQFPIKPIAV
jgi:hypothetical protein